MYVCYQADAYVLHFSFPHSVKEATRSANFNTCIY